MATKEEVRELANTLIDRNGGQVMLSISQLSELTGLGRHSLSAKLHEAGFMMRKYGTKKLITAKEAARFLLADAISPIDNTSKGA